MGKIECLVLHGNLAVCILSKSVPHVGRESFLTGVETFPKGAWGLIYSSVLVFLWSTESQYSIYMPSTHSIYHSPPCEKEKAPRCEQSNDGCMVFGKKSLEKFESSHGRHHQPQQLERNIWHRRFWKIGMLFLTVVVLKYIYLEKSFSYAFKHSQNQDNHPTLHFAPPKHWIKNPTGLFIDANRTWHMYFQCELCPGKRTQI